MNWFCPFFIQESVLDAKLREGNVGPSDGAQKQSEVTPSGNGPTLYNIPPSSLNHVVAQHLNLREAIVKYENIVEHLERLWESKVHPDCHILDGLIKHS